MSGEDTLEIDTNEGDVIMDGDNAKSTPSGESRDWQDIWKRLERLEEENEILKANSRSWNRW